ncbi:MAG: carboxypeptidase-like regulatory domain-containing protein [Prevotella sp.]|nr:carboxypeptidase-like regulatory domain-containing protein [Prevotella sp.]
MKRFFFFIILIYCSIVALGQSFTLKGRVLDGNMSPIELATVSVLQQGKVTMTNLKGEFSIQLHSADSVVVSFSMVGYKTKKRILRNPRGKQNLQIILYSDNNIDEIQVKGQKIQTTQTQELKNSDLKNINAASGNNVEKLVQMQAGVTTHSELSSQYNVRGGAFDENSVYINNIEVYRPFLVRSGQQEGLSVINPNMVEKIDFSTGGFESRYGDKMSSVLNITYKRPTRFEASTEASLMGGGIYVGYGNKKLSWTNSIRYKTNRLLLGSLETNGEYRPNFLDYQTYLSYRPNERWTIDLIGSINNNHYNFKPTNRETSFGTMENVKSFRIYFDGQEKDIFRTYFGSVALTRLFSKNTTLSLQASAFSTNERECYDIQGQYWLTQTETSENLGVGTYFEHTRNYLKAHVESFKMTFKHQLYKHSIEIGATLKMEHIKNNSTEYEMRDSSGYSIPHTGKDLYMIYSLRERNTINTNRFEVYAQDTWRFASTNGNTHFTLNYGIRLSHWNFNRETIVSPRLSLGIIPAFNENVTFRLATGLYYQAPFYKELRDTSTVNRITTVNLNRNIRSQQSIHFIAGYDYRFKINNRPFRFTAEAYYKALQNLIPYSVNNVKVVYYGKNEASGHITGLDLKLYGEFVPGTDSWLSLSVMDTKMKLHEQTIPMPTDQRYSLNLFFTDYFPNTDKWKMSLSLSLADGLPFSAPHQEQYRASFRAPAYKRADIGMSYCLFDKTKQGKESLFRNVWLGLECLNVFGINNVNSYYWVTDVTNQQYAVPNYLTGRMLNARLTVEF